MADTYSNTITSIKRLTTYNLYDLKSIENTLESFHHKWMALKVKINLIRRNMCTCTT